MPGTVLIAKSTHVILRQWSYEIDTDPYFVAEEAAAEFTPKVSPRILASKPDLNHYIIELNKCLRVLF